MWRAGDEVGAFRIEQVLATAGGRSIAYRATHGGEPAFLKLFLSPRLPRIGSPELIARKRVEAERFRAQQERLYAAIVAAQAQAPALSRHLAFLSGSPPYEGSFAAANEWLPLCDRALLRRAALTPDDGGLRRDLLVALAGALTALHARGVVHGDVKLDNIGIVENAPGAYAAKLFDYDHGYFAGEPRSGDFVFDPAYAAPEVRAYAAGAKGCAPLLDGAADVFAFARVCAEVLTRADAGADPESMRDAFTRAGAAPSLISALVAALAADKNHRPTMPELRDALASAPPLRAPSPAPTLAPPAAASTQPPAVAGPEPALRRPRLRFD